MIFFAPLDFNTEKRKNELVILPCLFHKVWHLPWTQTGTRSRRKLWEWMGESSGPIRYLRYRPCSRMAQWSKIPGSNYRYSGSGGGSHLVRSGTSGTGCVPAWSSGQGHQARTTGIVGVEGGVIWSDQVPQVQAVFPHGAVVKDTRLELQV